MRHSSPNTSLRSARAASPDGTTRSHHGASRPRERRSLRVSEGSDGAVVVAGDLDVASAETLEQALLAAERDRADGEPLVIDMDGVEFLDSSGLRTLVAASLRAGSRGTRVALRNARTEVLRMLDITGLRAQFGLPGSTAGDPPWRASGSRLDLGTRRSPRRG